MLETETSTSEQLTNEEKLNNKPIQKILFGSPGTGKSYRVGEVAKNDLSIDNDKNIIKTVFHPEYTYSDFIGKLLPQTNGYGSVIYKFYEGHFLQALGLAYKKLIDGTKENVLLVIDELNRGNAAAIFGTVFQLLDRDEDQWSSYSVTLSELEIVGLLRAMQYKVQISPDNIIVEGSNFEKFYDSTKQELEENNEDGLRVLEYLKQNKIAIPSNLSIIATINTSDESIYYLDSAFKRRWDWEYIEVPGDNFSGEVPEKIKETVIENTEHKWSDFVKNLNEFIKSNHQTIRRIEDKQIGWWFLKPDYDNKIIEEEAIKNKLMFYLWDSVFPRDRKPLAELLTKASSKTIKLITYSDFVELAEDFVSGIMAKKWKN